jgi:hypothetical protein
MTSIFLENGFYEFFTLSLPFGVSGTGKSYWHGNNYES